MLTMLTERDGVFSPPERRGKSMKQTVAVMAIILALLLMVSGYIVAEHAETTAELRKVLELGVDLLQGYCLARPAAIPPPLSKEAADIIRRMKRC